LCSALHRKALLAALDLNTYNLIFITVGFYFTGAEAFYACGGGVHSATGVCHSSSLLRRNFGMIVGTGIADTLAKLFASIQHHNTYPLLVAMYSAVLGVFIPPAAASGHRSALRSAGRESASVHLAGWCKSTTRRKRCRTWSILLDAASARILKLKAGILWDYGVLQLMVHIRRVLPVLAVRSLYPIPAAHEVGPAARSELELTASATPA